MKRLLTTILAVAYLVSLPAFVHAQSSYPASLSFTGITNNQIAVGQNFTIDVIVNTGGMASSGADVHVDYNPNELTYVSGEFPGLGGNFYPLPAFGPQDGLGDSGMRRVSMARTKQGGGVATTDSGTFAKLTFKPLGQIGGTTTLSFYFTVAGATTDSNVTSNDAPVDLLGTATPITLTIVQATTPIDDDDNPFVPGPGGTNPFITSVVPSSGHKDVMQQVIISGGNFANYQADKSKAYVGLVEATVLDWNKTRIVAQFPTNESITKAVTLTVRVLTAEDKEANYLGYTYTTGSLPGSGPAEWLWAGVLLAALGLSFLVYRKLSYSANQAVSSHVTQDGTGEDLYRF